MLVFNLFHFFELKEDTFWLVLNISSVMFQMFAFTGVVVV